MAHSCNKSAGLTSEKVAGATSWLMGNSAPPLAPFQPSLCVPLEQDVARSGDTDSQLTQREARSQGAPGGAGFTRRSGREGPRRGGSWF